MSQKEIKTRIQHKHDLEVNWKKAVNFTPLAGELIIYDADEDHPYPRFKSGDGEHTITELPFTTIAIDDSPAEGSQNPVSSAGVYAAIEAAKVQVQIITWGAED